VITVADPSRINRVANTLGTYELDALLVSEAANVRYLLAQPDLAGGAVLVSPELQLAALDRRGQFPERPMPPGFKESEGVDLQSVRHVLEEGLGKVGYEDTHLTPTDLKEIMAIAGKGIEFVPRAGIVEAIRELKEPEELRRIEAAMALTNQALVDIAASTWTGRSELEIALAIDTRMRELGAEGPAFPTIVNSQPRNAMAHGIPTDAVLGEGDLVLVDVGARLDGYASDCTRMFAIGALDEEIAEVYSVLRAAQEAGVAAVHSGAERDKVDAAARKLIADAGYGEYFGHSLGHGVGVAIHEGPVLSPLAGQPPLATGNVVTVEPGIYIPKRFGMRLEDLVTVTPEGCRVLSTFPKELTPVS
jgi:Xaa-Pro aminopeptidase